MQSLYWESGSSACLGPGEPRLPGQGALQPHLLWDSQGCQGPISPRSRQEVRAIFTPSTSVRTTPRLRHSQSWVGESRLHPPSGSKGSQTVQLISSYLPASHSGKQHLESTTPHPAGEPLPAAQPTHVQQTGLLSSHSHTLGPPLGGPPHSHSRSLPASKEPHPR